jgi:O-antigen/teichoic acid export membrane protein
MKKYNSRNIAGFTSLNIIGKVLPMIGAIVSIPMIINGLGSELFGVLIILWIFVGYASILDFGFSRGVIKVLSDYSDRSEVEKSKVINTSLSITFLMGAFSGLIIFLISDVLVTEWLSIESEFHKGTKYSIYIIACAYPFLITLGGLRSVLEYYQKFAVVNKVGAFYGSLNYLLPAVAVYFFPSLVYIVVITVLVRLMNILHLYVQVNRLFDVERIRFLISKQEVKPLFNYNQWIIFATIFAMATAVADRFIIGSLVSMTATAYYSTPLEILMKLEVIPIALVAVLFPAFTLVTAKKQEGSEYIYNLSVKLMALGFSFIAYFLILFSELILTLWLGPEFAENSTMVFKLLCIGLYFISIVYLSQTLVQGVGRPDLSALLYFILMVLGIPFTYFLIKFHSIEGAALARIIRAIFELWIISMVIHYTLKIKVQKRTMFLLIAGFGLLVGAIYMTLSWIFVGFSLVIWLLLLLMFWNVGITIHERESLLNILPKNLKAKVKSFIKL